MDPVTVVPENIDILSNAILMKVLEFGIQFCIVVGVVVGLVKTWRISKLAETNQDNIANIKVSVDGNLSAMLEMQKKLSFAAGQKQEVSDQAQREVVLDAVAAATAAPTVDPVVVTPPSVAVTEVTPQPGQELKIRAEAATVETDKAAPKGSGDLIITADAASVESHGKPKGKPK